jgi:hypothetical protein
VAALSLPVILAGPIVRRVEPQLVSVWLALSVPGPVTLKVWKGSRVSSGPGAVTTEDNPVAVGTAVPRRFGANLHIVVVTAEPPVPLVPGTLHAYDVVVEGHGGLLQQKLLQDETDDDRIDGVEPQAPSHLALGYSKDRLPGFVTPAPTIPGLRLAHASCRRPNYPGPDAMAWLDDRMRKAVGQEGAHWPQQLFLTGDQIYADDVGACMLPMLTTLGAELLGQPDQIPLKGGALRDVNALCFPPMRRAIYVRESARMTSTEANNHLLGFGEWAAMYLAAWSSRAWRRLGDDNEIFRPIAAIDSSSWLELTQWEACETYSFEKWRDEAREDLSKLRDQEAVVTYRAAVPKVARALANCSTYMMWDDHEVTDDWNLSGKWLTRVYGSPSGRAIVRNGTVAYGLFQGWGNDPWAYDAQSGEPNAAFLDAAEAMFAGSGPYPVAGAVAGMEQLLGFPFTPGGPRVRWHFGVDGPRHRAIVLDSRTHRDTGGPNSIKPPKLLGDTLDDQIPPDSLPGGLELLVVVAPAPVLSADLFDRVFQPLAAIATDVGNAFSRVLGPPKDPCKQLKKKLDERLKLVTGSEGMDAESWASSPEHQEALLARLAQHAPVVLLSGDVHYGFTVAMDYWRLGVPVPSRIVQLTSSGARNGWPSVAETAFRSNTLLQDLAKGVLVERLAWHGPAKINPPPDAIGPGRRARMKRTPALLPSAGWPAGTTLTGPPDWSWRLTLVSDTRTGGENGAPPDPPHLPDEVPLGSGSRAGFASTLAKHQQFALGPKPLMRTMMFQANIGLVDFRADGPDGYILTHRLVSKAQEELEDGWPMGAENTVHEVSLKPSGDAPPTLGS